MADGGSVATRGPPFHSFGAVLSVVERSQINKC